MAEISWNTQLLEDATRFNRCGKVQDRTLFIQIHLMDYSISWEVLDRVFSRMGNVEYIEVFGDGSPFHSTVRFQEPQSAIKAFECYNGRFIYDGCCRMELSLGNGADDGRLGEIDIPIEDSSKLQSQESSRRIYKKLNEIRVLMGMCPVEVPSDETEKPTIVQQMQKFEFSTQPKIGVVATTEPESVHYRTPTTSKRGVCLNLESELGRENREVMSLSTEKTISEFKEASMEFNLSIASTNQIMTESHQETPFSARAPSNLGVELNLEANSAKQDQGTLCSLTKDQEIEELQGITSHDVESLLILDSVTGSASVVLGFAGVESPDFSFYCSYTAFVGWVGSVCHAQISSSSIVDSVKERLQWDPGEVLVGCE